MSTWSKLAVMMFAVGTQADLVVWGDKRGFLLMTSMSP